jgi:hypothetical protein
MSTSKRVQHQRSLLSSLSEIWSSSSQSMFYTLAKSEAVADFAEAAVVK